MRKHRAPGMVARFLANDRGIALIITLFVVALVTVLILEYHFDASVELDLAANYASDVQAYQLALSGVSFARALLLRDDDKADGMEDLWFRLNLIPVCFPPQQLLSLAGDGGGGAFFLDSESAEQPHEVSEDDQGCVTIRIIDEQGKLPINALMPAGNSPDPNPIWRPIFEEFFTSFQIEEDLLDTLVDWIDQNDLPRGIGGAESSYYTGLEDAYTPPNKPMRTPGELRLVRGFNYETLAKLFPGQPPEAMADADLGTNRYLTIYGLSQEAKINLNTAEHEVLQALFAGLQNGGATDLVDEITTQRQEEQFDNLKAVNDLIPDSAVRTQLAQVADVKSRFFRVESQGQVGDIKKRVVAVLKRDSDQTTIVYFKVE